jgi:hypothetical protein
MPNISKMIIVDMKLILPPFSRPSLRTRPCRVKSPNTIYLTTRKHESRHSQSSHPSTLHSAIASHPHTRMYGSFPAADWWTLRNARHQILVKSSTFTLITITELKMTCMHTRIFALLRAPLHMRASRFAPISIEIWFGTVKQTYFYFGLACRRI